jgi:hypothetical protein
MGLDMYAYKIRADKVPADKQVDVDVLAAAGTSDGLSFAEHKRQRDKLKAEGVLDTDFAYWRKFNNLHGWMRQLYIGKGGDDPDFNCSSVRLMPEDLDALAAEAKDLKPTSGFFFGSQGDMTDEDVANVLRFVERAKAAIAEGYAVFYRAWY